MTSHRFILTLSIYGSHILGEYSWVVYVVDNDKKSNRGISNQHRELMKLHDEHPEKEYSTFGETSKQG